MSGQECIECLRGLEDSILPLSARLVCRSLSYISVAGGRGILRSSRRHGARRITHLLSRVCARLKPRYGGGCSLWVDLGVLLSFTHRASGVLRPSGWTLSPPLSLLLGLPVVHVRCLSRQALRLPLRCAQTLPSSGDTPGAVPCRAHYLAEHTTLCYRVVMRRIASVWRGRWRS